MSIVLQDLVKHIGAHTVVDHVSLEVHDGELLVLLGPSGSGKSTILRIIAGLIPADQGRVWLHGRDVTDLSPQQRNTGFVFQNYSLFRHMTVADNIEFGLASRHVPKAQRTAKREELLALVGLAGLGGRYPKQLSGGQQQRVAVARALAFEPSVLLLDEPFGALDVKIRAQLRQALKEIQQRIRVTTILVTHDQEEAFELADRIGVIDRGKLLEVGPPTALYRSPQQEFVATFLGGANLLAGQAKAGRVNLGSMELSNAASYTTVDPEGRLEVLFRPEDLMLATQREELTIPVLGQGVIEEVLFLGTLQRLRLRLQPLPDTWHLPPEFGETGVPIQIARIPRSDGHLDFQVGQQVWVGIHNFHILPRIPMRLAIGLDEHTNAEVLLNYSALLARITNGPLTVIAVAEDRADAAQLSKYARDNLMAHTGEVNYHIRAGRSPEELVRDLKQGAYDLLVLAEPRKIAPRAETNLRELVRRSPLPVLIVKGEHASIRRILFCTAGGEPGKRDIIFGGRIARRAGAATTLLYVDAATVRAARPWITNHLEEGALTLRNQGIQVGVKERHGVIIEEILQEIQQGEHDLVVIGRHLETAQTRFAQTDLASEILQRAECPVLIVTGDLNRLG
ncbi:MAG: ATP-binding cassette domain-containing protein [Chloroflexota bacterium]|nr:MAG: ATP-binding cassette domain-containing protein [Chloroflexota bacterium]